MTMVRPAMDGTSALEKVDMDYKVVSDNNVVNGNVARYDPRTRIEDGLYEPEGDYTKQPL